MEKHKMAIFLFLVKASAHTWYNVRRPHTRHDNEVSHVGAHSGRRRPGSARGHTGLPPHPAPSPSAARGGSTRRARDRILQLRTMLRLDASLVRHGRANLQLRQNERQAEESGHHRLRKARKARHYRGRPENLPVRHPPLRARLRHWHGRRRGRRHQRPPYRRLVPLPRRGTPMGYAKTHRRGAHAAAEVAAFNVTRRGGGQHHLRCMRPISSNGIGLKPGTRRNISESGLRR